ncbi:aldehyde dehydrogenase [Paeniglutamicibacter sp. MACA_103]|uniref:aldehyde dehydrogenase n=1 Tax=Paeniglutamicibacter sp. MACA_103 TaxID=3377337 RepID=UPI003894438F
MPSITSDSATRQEIITSDLFIGGLQTTPEGGRYFTTTEAVTGEPIAHVAAASVSDARGAVDAAALALPEWTAVSPGERRAILQRAAALLEERANELVPLMGREIGATAPWAGFNVHVATGMVQEAAAQTYAMIGDTIPSDVPGLFAMGVRQPAGVVIGIAPWNAPLILGVRAVVMPLAFGNTVVLKASEQAPLTQAMIVRTFIDAGVPAGVINLISNAPEDAAEVVEALISHPSTARVNFTGSTKIGRVIGEIAGRHLKRVVLELGGKAPMVVLADADLEKAAAAANFGAFMNQGEICMSTERLIVDTAVANAFTDKLVARASRLTVGAPEDPSSQLGPLVHAGARDHVIGLIEDAKAKGASVVCGGTYEGLYVRPTVLRGVTSEMRIYAEESFGPVVSIIEVDGVEAAIASANDSQYGLSAAVFTENTSTGLQVAQQIRSGICHINGPTVHDEPQMPFGGVGASGWGRFGSKASLEEFTELRWITIQTGDRHYPI